MGEKQYTINGPRLLPIDVYTTLSPPPSHTTTNTIIAQLNIVSAGGKGDFCGSCRIDYTLHSTDGLTGETRVLPAAQVLKVSSS